MSLRDTLNRPAYDIDGLMAIVPVKKTFLYEAMKRGELRATKCGRRTIFLADDVLAWLENLRAGEVV